MSEPEQPDTAPAPIAFYDIAQKKSESWTDRNFRVVPDAEILAHPTVVAALAERAACDRAMLIARADLIHRQSQELLDLEERAEKAEAALAERDATAEQLRSEIAELQAIFGSSPPRSTTTKAANTDRATAIRSLPPTK
jgi:hypothetical protein